VRQEDALALIERAVPHGEGGIWADLGAGSGTFTVALSTLLGPEGTVYAVERDASAQRELQALERESRALTRGARVVAVRGDFTEHLDLPPLDGLLLANALHYVRGDEQFVVLARLGALLKPHGRAVVIEYDRRQANPWVPYPIPRTRLVSLAREAGLPVPAVVATAPSSFGPELYCALIAP
jgi:ubiquinone/menaquinone biosynthesis C-methylase UbiE